jgi:hypothetical protein
MNEFWDKLGISTSVLCIVHCMATPFAFLMLPAIGHSDAGHNWFHQVIALIVFPVAFFALWKGYRVHHQRKILVLGGLGLLLIATSLFLSAQSLPGEMVLMILGGLLLAAGHYFNLRCCRLQHPH